MSIQTSSMPILGLLTLRPMSGYDLKKAIDKSLKFFWAESFGQLYPQLKRLCDAGLIALVPSTEGSVRDKKTYEITKVGKKALADWILKAPLVRPQRNELLLKMFFAAEGDPSAVKAHCQASRAGAAAMLANYLTIKRQLEDMREDRDKAKYWRMTLKLGISQTKNYIQWCDEIIEEF